MKPKSGTSWKRCKTVRKTGTTSRISFTPSILPRYLRKTKSVEELLPWLYLKGVSTGDFQEALAALLGPQAQGLSAGGGSSRPAAP